MSSGDIDDTLGDNAELQRLIRTNSALGKYIRGAGSLPIIRDFDIPFGAGISSDGQRRYIDRHLHTRFRGVDIASAPAMHEAVEWALRKFARIGVDYADDPTGHRLANRAELNQLLLIIPSSDEGLWRAYSQFIDPQVKRDETENIEKPPSDLALYPYRGKMLAHLIKKGVKDDTKAGDRDGTEDSEGRHGTMDTGQDASPSPAPASPRSGAARRGSKGVAR